MDLEVIRVLRLEAGSLLISICNYWSRFAGNGPGFGLTAKSFATYYSGWQKLKHPKFLANFKMVDSSGDCYKVLAAWHQDRVTRLDWDLSSCG